MEWFSIDFDVQKWKSSEIPNSANEEEVDATDDPVLDEKDEEEIVELKEVPEGEPISEDEEDEEEKDEQDATNFPPEPHSDTSDEDEVQLVDSVSGTSTATDEEWDGKSLSLHSNSVSNYKIQHSNLKLSLQNNRLQKRGKWMMTTM